jgi:hypothetical protein
VALMGIGTVCDSLAAIEKLVFVDRTTTLTELRDAMNANFDGYEELRQRLLDAPKYGNNDPFVDKYAADEVRAMEPVIQETIRFRDHTLLMDILPVWNGDVYVGSLVEINDKSDSVRMAAQLTGVDQIIGALRASTHETKNRMHVILGLLQIGEINEAMDFIQSASGYDEESDHIRELIRNNTLAALLIGTFDLIVKSKLAQDIAREELLRDRVLATVFLLGHTLGRNHAPSDVLFHPLKTRARLNGLLSLVLLTSKSMKDKPLLLHCQIPPTRCLTHQRGLPSETLQLPYRKLVS